MHPHGRYLGGGAHDRVRSAYARKVPRRQRAPLVCPSPALHNVVAGSGLGGNRLERWHATAHDSEVQRRTVDDSVRADG